MKAEMRERLQELLNVLMYEKTTIAVTDQSHIRIIQDNLNWLHSHLIVYEARRYRNRSSRARARNQRKRG
jgi:hypothetical protein